MNILNEYSQIKEVALRSPLSSFIDDTKLSSEWESLRFHSKPDLNEAIIEYNYFRSLLQDDGMLIIDLPSSKLLTIDSIYTRDSILISKEGLHSIFYQKELSPLILIMKNSTFQASQKTRTLADRFSWKDISEIQVFLLYMDTWQLLWKYGPFPIT